MSEGLPDLQEAVLDDAVLSQLVADLETHATVLDVFLKGGATERTDARAVPLRDAVDALRARSVRAVQVRYRYDGDEWRDTLMGGPAGIRLVRMKVDWA